MEIGPHPVTLLDDLQRGEREAFVRFFELYRLPVYNLVLALTHAGDESPAIVRDVFVTAYRQMLLAGGPMALGPWTYRAAVNACEDYLSDGGPEPAAHEAFAAAGLWEDGDLAARIAQALDGLSVRDRAALVLSDVYGLRSDDLAVVFDVTGDGARSLLFRAREDFRQAFEEVSGRDATRVCRLAEQAAAASVGRSLGVDEERKLRRHAEYCTACAPVVATWPRGVTGLALFLKEASLPEALVLAPVFATAVPAPLAQGERPRSAAAAGIVIPFDRALRRAGGAVASRAAAWAVAAVCLAATVGMAVYVAQFDAATTLPLGTVSVNRQVPHGERYGRQSGVFPPQGGGTAPVRGETVRSSTPTSPVDGQTYTVLAGASGLGPVAVAGGPASGSAGQGGEGDGAGTDGPEPAPSTDGGVGSGDAKSGRGGGNDRAKPDDGAKGQDKAKPGDNRSGDKPKNDKGDDKPKPRGNDKDSPRGNGDARAQGDKPAATRSNGSSRQSPPARPKAAKPKPKPTKQTRKPDKPQK